MKRNRVGMYYWDQWVVFLLLLFFWLQICINHLVFVDTSKQAEQSTLPPPRSLKQLIQHRAHVRTDRHVALPR